MSAPIDGIETIVSEFFNRKAVVTAATQKSDVRSSNKLRSFWECVVHLGDGGGLSETLTVFAKCAPQGNLRTLELERYLTQRIPEGVAAPRYFGSTDLGDGRVAAVWEFIAGHSTQFTGYSDDQFLRLMRALASTTYATRDAREAFPRLGRMRWIEPVSNQVKAFVEQVDPELRENAAMFSKFENDMLVLLGTMHHTVLNHNDIRGDNVILADDGRIAIVDWESATIGPPGAALRTFGASPPLMQTRIAGLYVDAMREVGSSLDLRQVIFTLRIQEMFWGLATGVKLKNPARVKRALLSLPRAVAAMDMLNA